jgi:hypothetical protein
MKEFILKENTLTDDVLMLPSVGKVFKGGYIAIIRENKFLNQWQDKETIKRFKSLDRLNNYLNKNYPDAEIDFIETCLQ